MIQPAFRQILIDSEAVAAIATGGVHLVYAPINERRPHVEVTRASHRVEYDNDNEVTQADGRMRFDCWADSYRAACELADAVAEALFAFEGGEGHTVVDSSNQELATLDTVEVEESGMDLPPVWDEGKDRPTLFGVRVEAVYQVSQV